ncbi:polyprenyl diphosphate synthase [Candidatus Comchoanobacter bicostacola]|uniref:Ditrans,polycis-undecaprenyl-diphosphate synthase ((2E,6E)-farnesyl-diphosphate specific) n=1 Tax=Candidatus Comchoanobacter bicostacola TaxID=2919598 RepID=A0ABY5DJE1_9GAMM|nr:polyprenyl diphosphate synthase [Candidatus Comchoanobacter bicostacola]UTC24661.1 polyprenyl diphosphate synthase [Candidatus Comchoanobacter bicostacola]
MSSNLKHVAIIMDGNGRWAQSQGMTRDQGHGAGSNVLDQVIETSIAQGVKHLTLFALSRDNISRPETEVQGLIALFKSKIESKRSDLITQGVRVCFIGDLPSLDPSLARLAYDVQDETKDNTRLILTIALNFSGSWFIKHTVKQLLADKRTYTDEQVSHAFDSLLPSSPDMLIRTGGEQRLSDFVMYHLAYTELFFVSEYWPSFTRDIYLKCIDRFAGRDRRFGQV